MAWAYGEVVVHGCRWTHVASGAAGRANFALHAKLSFSECKFPSRYKTASVTPLTGSTRVQKKELDPDVASNYTPISNLHTISKMLERLFMAWMQVWILAVEWTYGSGSLAPA